MSIDSIESVSSVNAFDKYLNLDFEKSQKSRFAEYIGNQVSSLNSEIEISETKLQQLATGESTNLHDVMLSLEKAKVSMELLLQVRNKVLEAYQELMRTQL